MSATLQPYVDQDRFTGIHRGDEGALERLVHDRFPTLLAEARSHLGTDGDAAARVVEHAIVNAWRRRAQFDDAGALDAYLHEALHDEAMRERSRTAARHRFEQHHGVKHASPVAADTAETVWRHVADALHRPTIDAAEHHAHVRHDAAEHVARIGQRKPWAMPLLIGTVVGGLAIWGMYAMNKVGPEVAATRALADPEVRLLTTKPAQEARVELNDGSIAMLRPETRVTVPKLFGEGTLRTVAVEGAATFTVKGGKDVPLAVRGGNGVEVVASDGEFVVRSDSGAALVSILAVRGAPEVRTAAATRTLGTNEAVVVDAAGAIRAASAPERDAQLAFVGGTFVAENQTLRAVLPQLRRWYGVTLTPRPLTLLDRTVSVRAPLGATKTAIAAVETSGGMKFGWEDKQMVLTDARGAPTTP